MSEIRVGLEDFNLIPSEHRENGNGDRDSWLPLNLATLPDKPPILPTLGALNGIGLLYPSKRHIFSGPQESAKTLCAYLCGLQVIRDGGTVVLLDFEMGAYDARARLQDLGATASDLGRLLYAEPDDPATEDRIALLIGLAPNLVIIDAAAGAYAVQGLDDNKRADVERLTNLYIRSFWRNGIATIMLDHVVKNTETRGAYAIGSERKVGGADVHIGFSVITPISRGHSGLYKLTTHKDRGGYLKRGTLAELALTSDETSHRITAELRPAETTEPGTPWMPTKVMQHISEVLEKEPEPVSRSQVIAAVGGKKEIAVKAIDHLVRLGYLTETAGPRGAKLLQHTRSFTVLAWENQPDTTTRSHPFPPVPGTGPSSRSPHPVGVGTGTGGSPQEQLTRSPDPQTGDWLDLLEPHFPDDPPADLHD